MSNNSDRERIEKIATDLGLDPAQLLGQPKAGSPSPQQTKPAALAAPPQLVATSADQRVAEIRRETEEIRREGVKRAEEIRQQTANEIEETQRRTDELRRQNEKHLEELQRFMEQVNAKVTELAGTMFAIDKTHMPKGDSNGIVQIPVMLDALIVLANELLAKHLRRGS